MEISGLPDDDLLTVLGFLPIEDLLRCRAVCRRWAALAGNPTLWIKRRIPDELSAKSSPKLVRAILRFAPCLDLLTVRVTIESTDDLWTTLISTSCATSQIELFIMKPDDAVFAAQPISRQASLGRLKVLTVNLFGRPASPANPCWGRGLYGLLLQICYTEGLEEFNLYENLKENARTEAAKCFEGLDFTTTPTQVSASLKRLLFVGTFHHFRDLLLQWHADTLEEVFIGIVSAPLARLASLLSSMPRLRKLQCRSFEGMRALLQCPALRWLQVVVYGRLPSEAVSYLSEAVRAQLETLKLLFYTKESLSRVSEPLLGLDGPDGAGATLRSLMLNFCGSSCPSRYQESLAGVLHRLPLLRLLDLDSEPTPGLLRALDGRALPELRELRVRLPEGFFDCHHHFVESEEVRGLMRRYPRLHVVLKDAMFFEDCEAAFCRDAGGDLLDYAWCMFYSHEAAAPCDVSHRGSGDDEQKEEEGPCGAFHVAIA